jgi:hypothetical protein
MIGENRETCTCLLIGSFYRTNHFTPHHDMVKKTVRLTADERAICRVRYKELMKVMDVGA